MTGIITHTTTTTTTTTPADSTASRRRHRFVSWGRLVLHIVVFALMVVWFTPVLGLFVSSFRTEADSAKSGWWQSFISPLFTGFNYHQAMSMLGLQDSVATSLAIAIPVTILTTLLSALGAFALTRMKFVGRTITSLVLVAMLVIPLQVTLVPILRIYNALGLSGTVPAVWIYQIGFTIPFGIFLLRGFMAALPEELFEAASLDGASTLRTFRSVVLPVSVPSMAALAIVTFLGSWNDLLIPLLFLGGGDVASPITVKVAGLVQATGQGEAMAMAATVISVLIPLILVISLQRYFVRGILGGSMKG